MTWLLSFFALLAVCFAKQPYISEDSDETPEPLFWSTNLNNIPTGESAWAIGTLSKSLSSGAQMALEHCQEMFKYDRWDCPKSAFSRRGSKPPNRETAFVLAITSAGVTHAVTRACSTGAFSDCTCQQPDSTPDEPEGMAFPDSAADPHQVLRPTPPPPPLVPPASVHRLLQRSADSNNNVADFAVAVAAAAAKANATAALSMNSVSNSLAPPFGTSNTQRFVWGGCSDHVAYGERIAARFLDTILKKAHNPYTFSSLHNNRVGRLAVRDTMEKHCKCHGVSGSCTLKTCWKAVASFSKIAPILREGYDRAVRVGYESGKGKLSLPSNVPSGVRRRSDDPPVSPSKLVYVEDSPDYCLVNSTSGWKGTRGRTCSRAKGPNVSKRERNSCRELCRECGLRVRRKKRVIQRNCQCTFQWCCSVQCKTCTEVVRESFCD